MTSHGGAKLTLYTNVERRKRIEQLSKQLGVSMSEAVDRAVAQHLLDIAGKDQYD